MRVLVTPDRFKGTLSSRGAARAIASVDVGGLDKALERMADVKARDLGREIRELAGAELPGGSGEGRRSSSVLPFPLASIT